MRRRKASMRLSVGDPRSNDSWLNEGTCQSSPALPRTLGILWCAQPTETTISRVRAMWLGHQRGMTPRAGMSRQSLDISSSYPYRDFASFIQNSQDAIPATALRLIAPLSLQPLFSLPQVSSFLSEQNMVCSFCDTFLFQQPSDSSTMFQIRRYIHLPVDGI